eukprot:6489301-Amphidinium_carterae.1
MERKSFKNLSVCVLYICPSQDLIPQTPLCCDADHCRLQEVINAGIVPRFVLFLKEVLEQHAMMTSCTLRNLWNCESCDANAAV